MAQKGKTKLRDLGRFKSGEQIKSRVQKATETGISTYSKELRLMEKAANERMRQLEKAGIKSPAYQAVQAQLEVLGKTTKGDRGRRFSESGKGTYNERELLNKILKEFLYDSKTSTLTGARQYEQDVWETANKNAKLSDIGITRDEWLEFWQTMPDKKERLYGSSQLVAMMRAYTKKNGELDDVDKMTMQEIAEEIQASKNLKDAYKKLGITTSEVTAARINYAKIRKEREKQSD